jgi:hypothetical protein
VISKTTKITHTVETGFAETTADKRSARSVIGPGEIPFYIFTLENQATGETGFALTCGDNRIGDILAVVEEGNYDDDHPFLNIFYAGLSIYIENTIDIYNSITQADIENALKKKNEIRGATAPELDVTDVGKYGGFIIDYGNSNEASLLPVNWNQGGKDHRVDPYNKVINETRNPSPDLYYMITGCGATAIAMIMAYHETPKQPTMKDIAGKYGVSAYNWGAMADATENPSRLGPDDLAAAKNAISVLMYEIFVYAKSTPTMGLISKTTENPKGKKEGASTSTSYSDVKLAFSKMGYHDPGNFVRYVFSGVRSSIDAGRPVMVGGWSYVETRIEDGLVVKRQGDAGHYWVIDGYRRMSTKAKNKYTGIDVDFNDKYYVHCNLGWGRFCNGWYIDGVFDMSPYIDVDGKIQTNIPLVDSGYIEYRSDGLFFDTDIWMLTNIKRK